MSNCRTPGLWVYNTQMMLAKMIAKASFNSLSNQQRLRECKVCKVSIYLYERSTCRYVRLNALNVLNVHGPCFNAPKIKVNKY